MDEKPAFVFDTNFFVQEKNLDKVLENLQQKFSVYVPQVCIEERIAQECRELRKQFDEIENLQGRCSQIASIKLKMSYEEKSANLKKGMQKKYEKWFGTRIIPFSKDAGTFQAVLDRAYQKLPPFLDERGASDKGFKDALLWISLLDYFSKTEGEDVTFITSDGGFSKNASWLCEEFHRVTGKTMEIKNSTYYSELLKNKPKQLPPSVSDQLPDVKNLREEIYSVLSELCSVETEGYWGETQYGYPFFLNQKMDAGDVKTVFENLGSVISKHLFDQSVPTNEVLDFDDRAINGDVNIPLETLEKVIKLYGLIKRDYLEYIQQFYQTAAGIIRACLKNKYCTNQIKVRK